MIIGIDIGGTNFRIGTVDNGELISFSKLNVNDVFDYNRPLESLRDFLICYINKLHNKIDTIVIGFPSTINKERTKVLQAPNLPYLENLDVVSYLQKELNIKVYIEKDTNLLMHYDINKYGLNQKEIVSCIYFGTGVGYACMINGKTIIGANGSAGELGHLYIEGNDEVCGCGNRGCNETLVGGHYLVKLCKESFKDCQIDEIFLKYQDSPQIQKYIDRMAIVCSQVINLLDPDVLIIGGGVLKINAFPKIELINRIKVHTRKPLPCNNLKLLFVSDDEKKGVIGAYYYQKKKM